MQSVTNNLTQAAKTGLQQAQFGAKGINGAQFKHVADEFSHKAGKLKEEAAAQLDAVPVQARLKNAWPTLKAYYKRMAGQAMQNFSAVKNNPKSKDAWFNAALSALDLTFEALLFKLTIPFVTLASVLRPKAVNAATVKGNWYDVLVKFLGVGKH